MLSLSSLAMQSPTAMEEGDANGIATEGEGFSFPAYADAPVGTGPFQFGEYDEANGTITLEAYDDYYGEAPASSELVFRVIPDEATRRQELEAGSINGYDLPNPADWAGLEDDGNQVAVRPAFNIFYVGLNPESNPALKDLKVRQALYYAIDREQLVQSQLPEGAAVATQFMPYTVSGYNSSLEAYEYDPEKAKQLLAEAGAGGPHLDVRLPDRGEPALHAEPGGALRRDAHEPRGRRCQRQCRDGVVERWLPGQRDGREEVRRVPARLDR